MNCPRLFNNRVSRGILGWQDGILHRLRIGSSRFIGSSRVVRIGRRNFFDKRKREIVVVEKG